MAFPAFNNVLVWAAKNERKLGAGFFAFGFLTDIFTFGLLPIKIVNYFFLAYLVLAALSIIGSHRFVGLGESENVSWWRRTLSVVFPLIVQYSFGGLLSGFLVFYTAHSFFLTSWPFIILIALVYVGNEYFRMYKKHMVFQTSFFFFTLYAYTVFALPLVTNTIGPWVFLGSTLLAALVFSGFLFLLKLVNKTRLLESIRRSAYVAAGIVLVVGGAYFLGLIPPVPLTLAESGVYHGLSRLEGGYRALAEEAKPWWNPFPPTVHYVSGETLYAFSAVKAPIAFSTSIVHRWEREVPGKGWTTMSRVAFPLYGGRENGYRGYSYHSSLAPGAWRVSVETEEGQVIGRMGFTLVEAGEPPTLIEQSL